MKTMKYFLGIAAFTLLTAIGVNAQNSPSNPQLVNQGSTHLYKVTNDHSGIGWTYNWAIAPAATPANTIATSNAASTTVTWGGPGLYTITLTETNPAGSCPKDNLFYVQVLGAAHLKFTSATSHSCASNDQNLGLAFTTDGTTPVTTADYYSLVIKYTVNGGTERTATFTFGQALEIPLTAADRPDLGAAADAQVSVKITGATANGGTVIIDGDTNVNTVNNIPALNQIIAN